MEWRGLAQVVVGLAGNLAAARRAHDKAFLDKEGFVHLLERAGLLAHSGGYGGKSDRAALELLDNSRQDTIVHIIQPVVVYIEGAQGVPGDADIDGTVVEYLRKVAHTAKQAIGNTGGYRGCGGLFRRRHRW